MPQGQSFWEEVGYVAPPQKKPKTFWEEYQQNVQTEEDDTKQRIINRTKNIGRLVNAGVGLTMGRPLDPDIALAVDQAKHGQAYTQAFVDIGNAFEKTDFKTAIKGLWDGSLDRLANKKLETLGMIAKMPIDIVNSLVGDTFSAVTGLDISGKEIEALEPEEHTRATKMLMGNLVAAAIAPAASKLITSGLTRGATGLAAEGTLGATAKLAGMEPRLGALGRAIVSDVGAGAAAGVAQGVVANANTPEAISSAVAGLMFAPIGVLTGWYRGTRGPRAADGTPMGNVELLIEEAKGRRQQLQVDEFYKVNLERAKEVAALRGWQSKANNLEEAQGAAMGFLMSDDIERVLTNTTPKKGLYFETDDLWNDFKTRLTEEESFASTLANYATEKKLTPYIDEMLEKFSTKYVEEGVDDSIKQQLRKLIEGNREDWNAFPKDTHMEMLDLATRKGVYLTDESGLLRIRDIDSGEMLVEARTSTEAIELMNEMGEPAHPVLMDSNGKVPSAGFKIPTNVVPAVSMNPLDDGFEPVYNDWTKRAAGLDTQNLEKITATVPFFEAIDTLYDNEFKLVAKETGTGFISLRHNIIEPLEYAHRSLITTIKERVNSGRIQLAQGMAKKMSNEALEYSGILLETDTIDNIMLPEGYVKGKTVSQESLKFAQTTKDLGVDWHKMSVFRRQMDALKYESLAILEKNAMAQREINKMSSMTMAEVNEIFDSSIGDWKNSEHFKVNMAVLNEKFGVDANFMKAIGELDKLYNMQDGAFHVQAAARIRLGLDQPDLYNITREDFIKKYAIKSDVVRLTEIVEGEFHNWATEFGIPDGREIIRFMNHMRQAGDIRNSYVVGDFERAMSGQARQFVSAMTRTGEITNYSRNPVLNLLTYIRAGTKSQILYPLLDDLVGKHGEIGGKGSKLEPIMKALVNDDAQVAQMVKSRLEQYISDISGHKSVGDKQAMHARAKMLSVLGKEEGRPLSEKEIIAHIEKPDHIDTVMALSTASLLGFRWSMALRDWYDMMQKTFIKHGGGRAWEVEKIWWKIKKDDIDFLVERGEITKPDPIDVYNVTYTQGASGGLSRKARDLADLGFRASLQGITYMRNQASTYIASMKVSQGSIKLFRDGKIDKAGLIEAVNLRRFDPSTQRAFNAFINDGTDEAAARLLARIDTREMAGTFLRGNQSPVLNTKLGKFFGQLGSWGMTNRSVMQQLLTRGTKKDALNATGRYAVTLLATAATGRALGLNLGRWALLPTSFVVGGGPLFNAVNVVGSASSAQLGGSEKAWHFAGMELERAVLGLVPFAGMAQDVKKAVELQTQGTGYEFRTAAQAIGIGVNTEDRSFLDIVTGNRPYKWDAESMGIHNVPLVRKLVPKT